MIRVFKKNLTKLKYSPLINFIAQQKSIKEILLLLDFYFNYFNSVWLNHVCSDNKIIIWIQTS